MKFHYKETVINYEIEGLGKPVVILHGLGCDLNMMKGCLESVFGIKKGYK
jgi:hypothetical protein